MEQMHEISEEIAEEIVNSNMDVYITENSSGNKRGIKPIRLENIDTTNYDKFRKSLQNKIPEAVEADSRIVYYSGRNIKPISCDGDLQEAQLHNANLQIGIIYPGMF